MKRFNSNFKGWLFMLPAILIFSLTACSDDDDNGNGNGDAAASVTIKFDHGWGPNHLPFAINTALMHPATQEEITFTKLRYYVTNIELHKADGTVWKEDESYRIVTVEGNSSVQELTVPNVPPGEYSAVKFMIGVDEDRNTSGAQEGALSPAENMFWDWSTGYIFFKAEGMSPAAPNGQFMYHIGGFEDPHNAIRTTTIAFGEQRLNVVAASNPSIHLKVNSARFWHGGISLADVFSIHMPGPNATTIADNWIGAFRFDHLHN
ncbi:MAG: hypothetical protein LAT54_00310 [Cryomorphaceae bacterium]|nr:hypothetical protein [Cryomorphaceae bacterium]